MPNVSPVLAPVKFKELLEELKQKFFTANLDWQLYSQLYRISSERIEHLNQAAGLLFGRVQQHMLRGVLLALSRLTDPAFGRKPKKGQEPEEFNLSVSLLVREIELVDEDFGKKLRADLDAMQEDIEQLHLMRNKTLAHNDFDYKKRGGGRSTLDRVSYEFIEDLFKRLHFLLNRAEKYYCEAETVYDFPMTMCLGDGDWLGSLLAKVFAGGDPRLNRDWLQP
jgi:hypothetical protein